jgi:hypothetical protein
MLRCVFMTCTLHVHDVFDEIYVMVRMRQVKSLFNFLIKCIFSLVFIIYENFITFWVEA